jgi:hypothetical protein
LGHIDYYNIPIDRERANMHSQGIACARLFNMGLTSAEGQKISVLN